MILLLNPGSGLRDGEQGNFILVWCSIKIVSTLLDITRAQNIGMFLDEFLELTLIAYAGIMLARIKLSLPEIRRALMEMDDRQLSIDELRAISKQLPTPDEVRLRTFAFNTILMSI